jgi:Cu/Ag efflux protein CusF
MDLFRILTALAVLGAPAAPASARTHRLEGSVTAVDREAKKITFTDHRGRVMDFAVGDDVKLEKDGAATAAFEDLQPGDRVALVYKGKRRLKRLSILPPRQAETPFGQGTVPREPGDPSEPQ